MKDDHIGLFCYFRIVSSAAEDASSEQMYFWLRGLSKVFEGEARAADLSSGDLIERATSAVSLILKGQTAIKAATSPYRSQEFQIR